MQVCTQAREPDYFKAQWDRIYGLLERNGRQDTDYWNGCWNSIFTGTEKSAMVEATFSLQAATRVSVSAVDSEATPVDSDAAPVDS